MKKITLVVALMVFSFGFSQNIKITGTVLDGEYNNEPLAFVNITVKETSQTITSDLNGKYTLNLLPGTYNLVYDFVGYETVEANNVEVKSKEIFFTDKILKAKQLSFKEDLVAKNQ